ncbi:MAG: hypothetical protein IKO80_00120 [Lachnospiraceae bacterium]|nr:hypothetical protein [Lachnospiraceae bacterium]
MNPMILLQIRERFAKFQQEHPKFMPFCRAVSERALQEGSIIDISVTPPDGKTLSTNLRLTSNDVEAIRMFINESTQDENPGKQ